MKRGVDLFISTIFLLVTAPLFLLIALAIKLDSKGKVIFTQKRVGQNRRRKSSKNNQFFGIERRKKNLYGKPFYIYKFRTMFQKDTVTGLNLTAANDARITRVGKFLRDWKLDELPQFLNVLKGDMSIVGPRPEVYDYVVYYSEEQLEILNIKPGITDLASIKFRNESQLLAQCENVDEYYINTIMPQKLQLNMMYLKQHSLRYDVLLILQTLKAIIFN